MKNFIQEGVKLTLTATEALVSGQGYKVGSLFGVVEGDAAIADDYVLVTEGVYELPKETGTAWVIGDLLYWDNAAKVLTKTSTSNSKAGVALEAAASGDAVGDAKLVPSI